MGGGGGSYSIGELGLKRLEQSAKDAIQKGSEATKRGVFISFAGEDLDEVNLLRGQAKNANTDLEFVDRSLYQPFNSKDAEYIKRGIRERIRQASVTVVYLTNDSAKSGWVDWEIRESKKQGKGVVAFYKGSIPPSSWPTAISEFGIKPVSWNHDKLMKAIDSASKKR